MACRNGGRLEAAPEPGRPPVLAPLAAPEDVAVPILATEGAFEPPHPVRMIATVASSGTAVAKRHALGRFCGMRVVVEGGR
jgi:hypothetical protein